MITNTITPNLSYCLRQKTLTALLVLTAAVAHPCIAQNQTYTIDVSKASIKIKNELKLGGRAKNGDQISVNNYYISRNNKAIIPITGEFHFSRYPEQYWEESIKKMKAGGINMIATYVFWNIHEEEEGKFDFSGDKNLRKFISLCAKNDILAIVRIGPFCHGEIRNGGLPDWILSKPFSIRSNDPGYLHYAEVLYNQIGKQLKGLYYKDGGPIIGIQIENEYQHSAAPWGLTYPGQPYDFTAAEQDQAATHEGVSVADENNPFADAGNKHMKILKSLAQGAGMDVPIYTVTGWGNAAVIPNESLPVTAGYAYPTWVPKAELSPFYLYKNLHQSPDYSPVRYVPTDYPAFAAELGSGIMNTYTRRPLVPANSMDALINRCLGGGANGIGYYMYHGGSTPTGNHYFFSDEAYGAPKISYDFQAPIGEYGQVKPSFHRLKLLHFFINDFADLLAPMVTTLPANNAEIKPNNLSTLRFAVRSANGSGFLFLNNFQDNIPNTDKKGISIRIKTDKNELRIPFTGTFNLKAEENAIFPFQLSINGTILSYATAQLLLKGDDPQHPYYVFFSPDGVVPEFSFISNSLKVSSISNATINTTKQRVLVRCASAGPAEFSISNGNQTTRILLVDKKTATEAYEVMLNGKKTVVFSNALILPEQSGTPQQNSITVLGESTYNLKVYPKIAAKPSISSGKLSAIASDPIFASYQAELPNISLSPDYSSANSRKLAVKLPEQLPAGLNDIFLDINYTADTGMGFLNGELVTDHLFRGTPWEIGLKRFAGRNSTKEMSFYFRPITKDAVYLPDLDPQLATKIRKSAPIVKVDKVSYRLEYQSVIKF